MTELQEIRVGDDIVRFPVDMPDDEIEAILQREYVDRSPVPLPEAEEGTWGGGLVPEFTAAPDPFTRYERDAAARGVDVFSELEDKDLRSALGFSPNEAFTADFLARKLSEKTGRPYDQMVQIAPDGTIEFYNEETNRFSPIDRTGLTPRDLQDMYGPTAALAPPLVGAIGAGLAGPWASIVGGGTGAFFGEIFRLKHGRNLGVHNLDDEAILNEGWKAMGIDVGAGVTGIAVANLYKYGRKLLQAETITADEAKAILAGAGRYDDELRAVNEVLEDAASKNQFILDPVAKAEDVVGLELRETAASGLGPAGRKQRVSEIKANESALEEYAKIVNRVDLPEGAILTDEGAEAAARPAQQALREREQAIRQRYAQRREAAIDDAYNALDELGDATRGTVKAGGGARARSIARAHQDQLELAKDDAYETYARLINQAQPGDAGFTEAIRYQSDIKIPIDETYVQYQKTAAEMRKAGVLTTPAQGKRPLKNLKVGQEIDLAVLDDNIKELRDVLRRGDPGFSSRKTKLAEQQLTRLRNDYLQANNPEALDAILKAEDAMTVYRDFVDNSVLRKILAQTPTGAYKIDDVAVFKSVFTREDGGAAMRALVDIANKEPGAIFGLQDAALRFYKSYVIPAGGRIMDRKKHDVFVETYKDSLSALFPDPSMLRFGNLEAAVARSAARAKAVEDAMKTSELWKLGHARPERMGKATFAENISDKEVRRTVNRLRSYGPETLQSYRDSVGREVYRRITTGGSLSERAILNLLETNGNKLTIVFGEQYSMQMKALARLIRANRTTVPGQSIPLDTLIGRLLRAAITPPLTRRGRFQTFVEKLRTDAAHKMIAEAVRDENVLRSIIVNANNDYRNKHALAIMSQTGAVALAFDDPIETDD